MIADAHVDLLMEVAYRERRLGESDVFAATWLPLLEQGGVGLQVCPIYVDIVVQPEGALREALSLAASFHRALRECGGRRDLDDAVGLGGAVEDLRVDVRGREQAQP